MTNTNPKIKRAESNSEPSQSTINRPKGLVYYVTTKLINFTKDMTLGGSVNGLMYWLIIIALFLGNSKILVNERECKMSGTKSVVLQRNVNGRLHRTVFKRSSFSQTHHVISVWERAARMGVNFNLQYLLDQNLPG